MPGSGLVQTARLGGNGAGERAHHDAAGFGLPPSVDYGAALAADFCCDTTSRPRD